MRTASRGHGAARIAMNVLGCLHMIGQFLAEKNLFAQNLASTQLSR